MDSLMQNSAYFGFFITLMGYWCAVQVGKRMRSTLCNLGAVIAGTVFKLFHIEDPVAQGLAMGTASHAIGTSKALEMGEIQAAMSSLAIAVTGIFTVIIGPIIAGLY